MIDPSFWKGRRVFVTGHTGFKGAWLCQWLLTMGAKVQGYSLEPPTEPNLFTVLRLQHGMDHVIGDVRDIELLSKKMKSFEPEIVFHLAAQPLVRLSYDKPRLTYETNVMGTLNLYEAVRESPSVRAVVTVTTDKCYENQEWVWGYRESDPMGGFDPYSSSKGCAEIMSAAYRRSFFRGDADHSKRPVALATVRAGNVIGGGDWALDRLVPDCIRALVNGEEIVIRQPNATRPWQHVLEPLCGYLQLGQTLCSTDGFDEAWNLGPGDSGLMTVEQIVQQLTEKWGAGTYRIGPAADLHEATHLQLDISKAKSRLKWRPALSIFDAISWTVSWYRSYYSGRQDMRDISNQQIADYSSVISIKS